MAKLKCIKEMSGVTVGKSYHIKKETKDYYVVILDKGTEGWYTKEPDQKGKSYKTWFTKEIECDEL